MCLHYRRFYGCFYENHKNSHISESKKNAADFDEITLVSEAYIFTKELFTNTGLVLYEVGRLHVLFKLLGVQIAPPQKIPWLFSFEWKLMLARVTGIFWKARWQPMC